MHISKQLIMELKASSRAPSKIDDVGIDGKLPNHSLTLHVSQPALDLQHRKW